MGGTVDKNTGGESIGARVREAREIRGLDVNELGRKAGVAGGDVSRIENGLKPRPGALTVARLADALRVRIEWLALGRGPRDLETPEDESKRAPDPTAGSFLLKLYRTPGLREWVEDHPEAVTVSELLRGMRAYEVTPPRSRSDGRPSDGWGAFFADVLAGRLDVQPQPTKRQNDDAPERDAAVVELRQLGGRTRQQIVSRRRTKKK